VSGFEFKNPLLLILMVPYAAGVAWYILGGLSRREPAIAVSSERVINKRSSIRASTYRYLPVLRMLAVLLLILAISRPGRGVNYTSVKTPGIDIVLTLDVSDSMMGEDFMPKNRLEVERLVVKDFVARRSSDRIGMVVFSGDAYLQCPPTIEYSLLNEILDDLDFNTVEEDGTAIGDALALAASRLTESKAKSRVILLITDGMNNRGSVDPETAAGMCAGAGIRVYTVGIGKDGQVPYPASAGLFRGKRYIMNHFDGTVLQKIADVTGGKYYRADSSGVLWQNIHDIDRLEKTDVEARVYYEFYDRFQYFLIAAAALFFIEIILRSVVYRKLP
jgi:Ca-activated chloride channel homolog